jgi:hypothetical protein
MVAALSQTLTLGPIKRPKASYDIDEETLFGQFDQTMGQDTTMDDDTSIEDELRLVPRTMPKLTMGRKRSKRPQDTWDQWLCKSGMPIIQIQFAVPRKKEIHIGGRSPKISKSGLYLLPSEFIVNATKLQSKRDRINPTRHQKKSRQSITCFPTP